MSAVTIRQARADDTDDIRLMDRKLFPGDEPVDFPRRSIWFIALEGGEPVAFAGVQLLAQTKSAFMLRAGVLPSHRGRGLQRALIAARERAARRAGMRRAVTYTVVANAASMTNLTKARYATYYPKTAYAGRAVVYWQKKL